MNFKITFLLAFLIFNFISFAQPCNMILTTAVNNAMGGGPNGTISLSVNGGTPPYSFVWSNGQTTQNATMLPPGCYTVVVSDAAGCQSTVSSCGQSLLGPILYSNSNPVSTFSVVNGGFTPQWVCPNQTLQTDGGIMKIYLESGATMITGGGIDTVYAKTGTEVEGHVDAGKHGVDVGAGASIGEAAGVEGEITESVRYGSGTVGTGVSVGEHFEAGGSAEATFKKGVATVGVAGDVAAYVGLDADVSVSVDTRAIVKDGKEVAHVVEKEVPVVVNTATKATNTIVDTATKTSNTVVNTAKSTVNSISNGAKKMFKKIRF